MQNFKLKSQFFLRNLSSWQFLTKIWSFCSKLLWNWCQNTSVTRKFAMFLQKISWQWLIISPKKPWKICLNFLSISLFPCKFNKQLIAQKLQAIACFLDSLHHPYLGPTVVGMPIFGQLLPNPAFAWISTYTTFANGNHGKPDIHI